MSGTSIISTESNGSTHSSFTPYFSRRAGFSLRSLSARQSMGESLGTLVTTPVPLSIRTVSIGRAYTVSYLTQFGGVSFNPTRSCPDTVATHSTLPNSGDWPWYAIFSAARAEQTPYSSLPMLYTPYSPSGSTQQLVWPYIVSGRRVAATRDTFLPPTAGPNVSGYGSCTSNLTTVYSCGFTFSPSVRSWSRHACPSDCDQIT
mmetsp:Transcript_14645/g.41609  ORF Transcript_14645/g.41609 Transcript_14645/m.41609 type:complete len:203 (-) Transcript_14645:892-1500(-)